MKQNITEHHIVFILDRSGSMSPHRADTIGGFNAYIDDLRESAKHDGLTTTVSLVLFNNRSNIVFSRSNIDDVSKLNEQMYVPRGNTALLDTVYDTVRDYREAVGQGAFGTENMDAPPVLVVVFTDGLENASARATHQQVQELIAQCEAKGNWTFVYVGAHSDQWRQHHDIGIGANNTLQNDVTSVSEKMLYLSHRTRGARTRMQETGQKRVDAFMQEEELTSKS